MSAPAKPWMIYGAYGYTGDALANLVEVASSSGGDVLRRNAEVSFQATAGTTYWIAIDGADDGGAPVEGVNYGHLTLTIAKGTPQP